MLVHNERATILVHGALRTISSHEPSRKTRFSIGDLRYEENTFEECKGQIRDAFCELI
jgi:hypothetical protein